MAYIDANPKSNAIADTAGQYFPGGSTRASLQMAPFTLTFARGTSATLFDVDGHEYADFLGEYTAGIFGHDNKTILAAIHEALGQGWNLGGHSVYESRLARMVCERFGLERVRFTNSGTEANTFAVATALAYVQRAAPEKKRIMVFDGAYHGGTFKFPIGGPGRDPLNLPHDFLVAPFDDLDGTKSLFEDPVLDLQHTLAAVLIEPMQGNAGARPARPDFLRLLRDQCTRLGAILIFDEVQTSRLGPHGLGTKLGIFPDLTTFGKWIGGGMTFGAFGGQRALMDQYGPHGQLTHAGTFNNNVISMAAGTAGLEILTEKVLEDLNGRGDRLRERLNNVFKMTAMPATNGNAHAQINGKLDDHEAPVYVTGVGSILSINFRGQEAGALRALFWHAMVSQGIYFSPRGFVALSIEVTDEQVARFTEAAESWVKWYLDVLDGRR